MTRGLRMRLASPVTFDREDCEVAVVITRGKWELLMTICVCVCSDLQIMAPPINGIRGWRERVDIMVENRYLFNNIYGKLYHSSAGALQSCHLQGGELTKDQCRHGHMGTKLWWWS